jgi:hypothetical protein
VRWWGSGATGGPGGSKPATKDFGLAAVPKVRCLSLVESGWVSWDLLVKRQVEGAMPKEHRCAEGEGHGVPHKALDDHESRST